MKIREVCRRTGLTERTVRYWAAEGLISPATYELNDRSYFDFTEADITRLNTVATLRRIGFSVAEVAEMQKDPAAIPERVRALRETLRTQAAEQEKSAGVLAGMEVCTDLSALAQRLAESAENRPLPELDPHFGRFDLVTAAERQERYAAFQTDFARRSRKRQTLAAAAGAALLVLLSVFSTLAATGQLPKAAAEPDRGWETRISGEFSTPFQVFCGENTEILRAGTDADSGRPTILLSAEGQELTLCFRRLGDAEAEFFRSLNDTGWEPAPDAGAHDAVCCLPAGEDIYEIHAVCAGMASAALPEFLERCLKISSYSQNAQ